MLTKTIQNGNTYYSMTHRGVAYMLRCKRDGSWELSSRRLSLGRGNVGSVKFYDTLDELERSMKAFRGVAKLLADTEGAGASRH
ncbi:hypothetical protein [Pseudomonas sp.]|uniref:hypothetical protein n=1 Tax=Pseudomonas sp. TaxID=306 RepID=UPI0029136AA7|nr:hypothetical protein [Pseudomonas sp.]MDU4254494.1 hypothetical protein [Pseudomonas sp.]